MKIDKFIEQFTINPIKDIKPNFKLIKTIDVDTQTHKGCFNCGDTANKQYLKSIPWTGIQYCLKCNSINAIYFSDRMGGNHTYTIYCYTEH